MSRAGRGRRRAGLGGRRCSTIRRASAHFLHSARHHCIPMTEPTSRYDMYAEGHAKVNNAGGDCIVTSSGNIIYQPTYNYYYMTPSPQEGESSCAIMCSRSVDAASSPFAAAESQVQSSSRYCPHCGAFRTGASPHPTPLHDAQIPSTWRMPNAQPTMAPYAEPQGHDGNGGDPNVQGSGSARVGVGCACFGAWLICWYVDIMQAQFLDGVEGKICQDCGGTPTSDLKSWEL